MPASKPPEFGNGDDKEHDGKHEGRAEKHGERDLERELDELRAELASVRAGVPDSSIPENGGGPGTTVAPTWSQAEQEAANEAAAAKKK